MGTFRSSKTLAVIATACALAHLTNAADAASQHLRHRHLQSRDYQPLGCFKDNKNDRVLGNKLTDDQLTTDFCYDICVGLGASLMATQYSNECWCATDVEVDYGRHGDAECNRPCAGDSTEMCGGDTAFHLYQIGSENSSGDDDSSGSSDDDSTSSLTPSPTPHPTSSGTLEGAIHPDIVKIISVEGDNPRGASWADSYSVGKRCYMYTTFDHDIGRVMVDTPEGRMTIRDLFDRMGPGPGAGGRPLYNDIQCGNGPANSAIDERRCPGLVEHGPPGCGQIGPKWDLSFME